jgi:tRNA-uridine 2-sulfurtransferase
LSLALPPKRAKFPQDFPRPEPYTFPRVPFLRILCAPAKAVSRALISMDSHLNQEKVVVAMSGGVDSSVAAWMLSEAGHELVGLFMRNGVKVAEEDVPKKSCCSVGDARDARMVAARLEIPFQAVDLGPEFGNLIDFFVDEYSRGRTPNPCALCNRDLKFGRLLEFADELGCEAVATGHYARLDIEDGRPILRRGVDHTKDQSYQLFSVSEAHLLRTRLPLGGLQKTEVRAMASNVGLKTAQKPDSQEICFVPSNDYRVLLAERNVELHPGNFVNRAGKRLGKHKGTEHFTIGQRRGHGIGGGTPLYVVDLRTAVGEVVLGTREECFSESLLADDVNWIGFDPASESDTPVGENIRFEAEIQVRYHHAAAAATIELLADEPGVFRVHFHEPQSAVAPGQGAAIYRGDRLLGGGWIRSAVPVTEVSASRAES